MASVFDLFKPATPAAAPVNANPTVPSATTVPAASTENNNTAAGASAQLEGTVSPMDKFKDLWEPIKDAAPNEPFKLNSDPAKLMELAKGVDFTKVMTPELQKRIQAGGSDAMAAMVEMNNAMSQMVFGQSAHATAKIVENALQAQEKRFQELLPSIIKQHSIRDTLKAENPLMSDPAMAPMVDALQQQFTRKYPQASIAEIQQHVSDYLDGAASRIQGLKPPVASPNTRLETDWSKFLG